MFLLSRVKHSQLHQLTHWTVPRVTTPRATNRRARGVLARRGGGTAERLAGGGAAPG